MKKIVLTLLILILFINVVHAVSVYNQKSVREYKDDMDKIQRANNSYTLKIKQRIVTAGNELVLYHKAYMKADKWKALSSSDGGKTYTSVMLFDGKDS